jgi:ubiquinol-cytochrome c reductase cytochrome b subunit
MLGEIAMYAFVALLGTGIWIALQFDASDVRVVYRGAFGSLDGRGMSSAYASTLRLSSSIPLGLLMRQAHHWAALIFVCAIVCHLFRIFFTGAFRKPRDLNWIIGMTMLIAAMAEGFTGYSLPDDLLSGTGLRIAHSIVISIPLIGTWLAFLLFGGKYPSDLITGRLFTVHVFLIPGLIIAALIAHLAVVWHQKHTQFRGPRRTEQNVVGSALWPNYTVKSIGLGFGVFAVIALLGGAAQINPIWLYGPYDPWTVASPAQPDWYVGWLDGALRLAPAWDIHLPGGHVIPSVFLPGVLLPIVGFGLLYAWPSVERAVTKDDREHHFLDLLYEAPWRTGTGVALFAWAGILLFAGSDDVQAALFHVPVENLLFVYRILFLVLPPLLGLLAFRVCIELKARSGMPPSVRPKRVMVRRTAEGGYGE